MGTDQPIYTLIKKKSECGESTFAICIMIHKARIVGE